MRGEVDIRDMRAQWHLRKKKKTKIPMMSHIVRIFSAIPRIFLVQARRTRAFSSVFRDDDARPFLLRHHRAALPPSFVNRFHSVRPYLSTSFLASPSRYFAQAHVLFWLAWVFPVQVPPIKVVILASGAFWANARRIVVEVEIPPRDRCLLMHHIYNFLIFCRMFDSVFVGINWNNSNPGFLPSNSFLLSSWLIIRYNVIYLIIPVFVEKLRKSLHSLRNEIFFFWREIPSLRLVKRKQKLNELNINYN